MRSPFVDDLVRDLLSDLHDALERVAGALLPAHPQLAAAMRAHATRLPPPPPTPTGARRRPPRALPPLAYRALDHGLIDATELDRLLLRHRRAKDVLRASPEARATPRANAMARHRTVTPSVSATPT